MASDTPDQKPIRPKTMRPQLDTQLPDYNNRDSLQDLQDQHDLGMLEDEPEATENLTKQEKQMKDDPNRPETEEDGIGAEALRRSKAHLLHLVRPAPIPGSSPSQSSMPATTESTSYAKSDSARRNDDELPPAGSVSFATGMRALYLRHLKRSGKAPPNLAGPLSLQHFGPPTLPEWDGPIEVVFSLGEESRYGGSSSFWVERRGNEYILFGSDLGQMSEPCLDPISALMCEGTEFGMDYIDIRSSLPLDDFLQACEQITMSNVSQLIINGVEVEARDLDGIATEYKAIRSVSLTKDKK